MEHVAAEPFAFPEVAEREGPILKNQKKRWKELKLLHRSRKKGNAWHNLEWSGDI